MAKLSLARRELMSGELPLLCMKCGETVSKPMKKTLVFWPTSVRATVTVLFLFCGGLLGLIAYLMLQHKIIRIRSKLPMCDRHRKHWRTPYLVMFAGIMLGVILLLAPAAFLDNQSADIVPIFFISGLVVMVIGILIGAVMTSRMITIESVKDEKVKLLNICPDFIAAVATHRKNDQEAEVIDEPPVKRRRIED